MPVEMGSFDAIIGMDWLSKYSAVIDCAKKIVRIPSGSEILIVHGDGCSEGHRTRPKLHLVYKVQKVSAKKDLKSFWHMDLRVSSDSTSGISHRSSTCSSPWGAPVSIRQEEDGSLWMCRDYRETKQTNGEETPLSATKH
ncbi:putative reverse transcriptase domain-containing protein [Tanacetum coccineum]|uniref:Reverse transcriptase domain-containing protein n=1 Tax=Tanacetum coccineum TaxID=301880 RepID=A0ABQ5DHH1_9ASTR